MRFCLQPGCGALVARGYCVPHARVARRVETRHYRGIPGLHYGRRWQRVRDQFLSTHPACAACARAGVLEPASQVDHVIPHRGRLELFWNWDNLQSLCVRCHARKTQREVG
jgi:5-methylcytosine-specific restriction enzyme A